ncbi:hypothetical protein [Natronorubrum sp. FCH18a]|uniref:hypothetical protein n=1 Tax=Natronorubrum sp. FCH18a TaxID=3447018 RepID=UPI003F518F78
MNDAVSSADDRLRLVLALVENDLESVTATVYDRNAEPYCLRARVLEAETHPDNQADIHVEESADPTGEEWLNISQYDGEMIDDLAVMHRKQVRELQVREKHPQSDLSRRQRGRARQKVRNRKALREQFRDARLTSWTRKEQVVANA